MSYTSTLLTPSTNINTLDYSTKGNDYRTDFEQLLEFHDEIYTAHFNYTNQYYKALLESDEVLNEGVFGAISGLISTVINVVRSTFNIIFGGKNSDTNSNASKAVNTVSAKISERIGKNKKDIELMRKTFDEKYKSNSLAADKISMKDYSFGLINGKMIEITEENVIPNPELLGKIREIYNHVDLIYNDVKSNQPEKEMTDEEREQGRQVFPQVGGIINECDVQLRNLKVSKYKIFNPEFREVSADGIYQQLARLNMYEEFKKKLEGYSIKSFPSINEIMKKLEVAKEAYEGKLKNMQTPDEKEFYPKIKTNIDLIKGLLVTYTSKINEFVNYAKSVLDVQFNELKNAVAVMIGKKKSDTVGGEVTELAQLEATILDEQFSNSLAAVFKDLKWSYMDAYRQGYVNEAVILAEGKDVDKKLIELNEAISSKVKSAFNTAVEKIRKLFATFMEKLRRNVTSTKNYLDKYKKYILGTTINVDYKDTNIIEGMYRVMKYTVPAFDFKTIDDKGGFANAQAFFDKALINNIDRSGTMPKVTVDGSDQALSQIGEWFKEYFGCAGETVDVPAAILQRSIKDIYDFMYDTSKIEKSINDSIKNVEGLRDRALKQAGVEFAPNESFTYLGHTPALLLEKLEVSPSPQPSSINTNPTAPTNYTGKVASNMTNVAKTGIEDKNGQEQYGVGQTVKEDVEAKCNVYIQCVTKVLQAKLTAVEYLRNDFMSLFKTLVERNIEGTADPNGSGNKNTSRMPNAPTKITIPRK